MSGRIKIIAGHYGAGKTNVAVALALAHKDDAGGCVLCDLDTVNPYFRAADNAAELNAAGVRTVIPAYANTNVDIPVLPAEIASVFCSDETVIFDVGGDDGASALGVYAADIERSGYEMLAVVNMYRPLIADPADAVAGMREIEQYSRLRFTGIVNNSNLGAETTKRHIEASAEYAQRVAALAGLPLVYTTVVGEENAPESVPAGEILVMKNSTKQLF